MPGTYQTSLGLTILHHDPHPHSRTSNNSTWGQWRRNHGKHILERSKSLHTTCNSSTIGGTSQGRCLGQKTCQKNLGGESPVARIEIALQLSYGDSTAHRQKDNQVVSKPFDIVKSSSDLCQVLILSEDFRNDGGKFHIVFHKGKIYMLST
jgi:hypothetical protein